jgi:uncharacterized membrane protein YfcA
MDQAVVGERPGPNGVLLGLGALAITGVSTVAWLLIALGSFFSWLWSEAWIYTGLALPAAAVGAVAAHVTERRTYFWLGFAITLIPLIAYILLEANAPPPPPGWND